jgi:hypothetical protein
VQFFFFFFHTTLPNIYLRRRIRHRPTKDDSLTSDEFQKFIYAAPTVVAKIDTHWNPINWWIDESKKDSFDTLYLYALNHLPCPTMANQCERAFSAARSRKCLGNEGHRSMRMPTVVVEERGGLGHANSISYDARAVVEAQFVAALVGDSTSSDVSEAGVDESYNLLRGRTFPIRPFRYLRCP